MKNDDSSNDYADNFSEKNFWQKLRSYAIAAGKEVVEKVLALYHAARDPDTPVWAKTVIVSTLGYFILPVDAIPDVIPGVGYADDLGALTAAIGIVAVHIKPKHWKLARSQLHRWFGTKKKS